MPIWMYQCVWLAVLTFSFLMAACPKPQASPYPQFALHKLHSVPDFHAFASVEIEAEWEKVLRGLPDYGFYTQMEYSYIDSSGAKQHDAYTTIGGGFLLSPQHLLISQHQAHMRRVEVEGWLQKSDIEFTSLVLEQQRWFLSLGGRLIKGEDALTLVAEDEEGDYAILRLSNALTCDTVMAAPVVPLEDMDGGTPSVFIPGLMSGKAIKHVVRKGEILKAEPCLVPPCEIRIKTSIPVGKGDSGYPLLTLQGGKFVAVGYAIALDGEGKSWFTRLDKVFENVKDNTGIDLHKEQAPCYKVW